jgi:two-component system OmpR family response regulator
MTTPTPALQKILYVDDDRDIREVAKLSLEGVGRFTLRLCASGAELLAEAPKFGPDLLLLDVMMPEMDGVATLAALRKIPSLVSTPVVFMTAKAQACHMQYYRDLGAVEVVAKPFQAMQLPTQLRAIWSNLHGAANPPPFWL